MIRRMMVIVKFMLLQQIVSQLVSSLSLPAVWLIYLMINISTINLMSKNGDQFALTQISGSAVKTCQRKHGYFLRL